MLALAPEFMALLLIITVFTALMLGYPVAFTLGGMSLLFAGIGIATGVFDAAFISALPNRLYGIITNQTLIAIPLFVFMGIVLERARIAEELLEAMETLFGSLRGGLGISVTLVGMLLAASTGIVGATVVTMGLLSLPTMLKNGYAPAVACGTICASGTLGQIIPPSIVLVLLGDVLSSAYQQAQLAQGIFAPDTVSVGDLFIGALIPGLLLVLLYMVYLVVLARYRPASIPKPTIYTATVSPLQILKILLPPLTLIVAVLGSILAGYATPTEAASVGAIGSLILAASRKRLSLKTLQEITQISTRTSCMVFMILIGATLFSLVFLGFSGDDLVSNFLQELPGGKFTAILLVMLLLFALGFILDFIEIVFIIVPIVGPILLAMDIHPVWLGIMIAVNLQTSFLTPPFGFALFYLRGAAPDSVRTIDIYKGVSPYIGIQLFVLLLLALWPGLATWLPDKLL